MVARFRYALEPVLVTRQWRRDDLRQQLARAQRMLEGARAARDALRQRLDEAECAWSAALAQDARVDLLQVQLHGRHAAQCAQALRAAEERVREASQVHGALAGELAQASREVDAVSEHKDAMRGAFHVRLAQVQGVEADDHWSTLQNRRAHDAET